MEYIKVYIYGIVILVSAIVFNYIATLLGLTGWYEFIKEGFTVKSPISYVWLFVFYPLLLGVTVYLIIKFFN